MRHEFQRRRDAFVAGLNRIKGFSCRMPKGAFTSSLISPRRDGHRKKLADALLEEAGVACLSGRPLATFGEGYLRFSVANSLENLNQALKQIDRVDEEESVARP